jgi:ABC-type transporter Mla maintaining outer membrane lipid asymmetry ATPase subunit MlaF
MSDLVLEIRGVEKRFGGIRPLRIQSLEVASGQAIALLGLDAAAAEVFVNLATGATAPDAGEVRAFGVSTRSIADADAWLASLDRFGLVSERAVLLDGLTVLQNLAMPLTLEVDPLPDGVRAAVTTLAGEVGIAAADFGRPIGSLPPATRLRVRLGRALALNPRIVLAEHPNASLAGGDVPAFAADFSRLVAARGIASVTLTADRTFAAAVAEQVLALQPATGELKPASGWRGWFAGR